MTTDERQHCTKDVPMPPNARGQWDHDRVIEVGDQWDDYPGGDIQGFKCLNCGHEWKEELPQ